MANAPLNSLPVPAPTRMLLLNDINNIPCITEKVTFRVETVHRMVFKHSLYDLYLFPYNGVEHDISDDVPVGTVTRRITLREQEFWST